MNVVTKLIALLSLCTLLTLNSLGNYWFTYGIWPKSWMSFVGFFVSGLVITALISVVNKKDE